MKRNNAQQIFDTAMSHLLIQGKPSINENGICVYRGKNGLKCPVGAVISNKEYRKSMEDNDVECLESIGILPTKLIPHIELLKEIQYIHDSVLVQEGKITQRFLNEVHQLAIDFNLSSSNIPRTINDRSLSIKGINHET